MNRPPPVRSDRHCGPTLLLSMVVFVVLALVALFVFHGHNRQDAPNTPSRSVSNSAMPSH